MRLDVGAYAYLLINLGELVVGFVLERHDCGVVWVVS